LVDAHAAVWAAAAEPVATPVALSNPGRVTDAEPNDSIASAQPVTHMPTRIAGNLASQTDNDHFLVNVNPGKLLTITLTPQAGLGVVLGVYLTTGQQLLFSAGQPNQTQQVQLNNSGRAAVPVVLRVLRSSGSGQGYELALKE
jgi:hypothetical protein